MFVKQPFCGNRASLYSGERGVNLSGGQKSRVSLARALYRFDETDIYFFDDPLSAVDMEVGDRMFSDGVDGKMLRSKTRLIVMNSHLHLLARCHKVIVLDKGRIVAMDSYDALLDDQTEEFARYKSLMINDMDVREKPDSLGENDDDDRLKSNLSSFSMSEANKQTTSFTLFENAQTQRKLKGEGLVAKKQKVDLTSVNEMSTRCMIKTEHVHNETAHV